MTDSQRLKPVSGPQVEEDYYPVDETTNREFEAGRQIEEQLSDSDIPCTLDAEALRNWDKRLVLPDFEGSLFYVGEAARAILSYSQMKEIFSGTILKIGADLTEGASLVPVHEYKH